MTGLLFQPFYRLQYIVMILLAAFAVWTVLKKDLYFIGIYLSFFVAAVASYLDKYPINKRLWLFIYPLITIIYLPDWMILYKRKIRNIPLSIP